MAEERGLLSPPEPPEPDIKASEGGAGSPSVMDGISALALIVSVAVHEKRSKVAPTTIQSALEFQGLEDVAVLPNAAWSIEERGIGARRRRQIQGRRNGVSGREHQSVRNHETGTEACVVRVHGSDVQVGDRRRVPGHECIEDRVAEGELSALKIRESIAPQWLIPVQQPSRRRRFISADVRTPRGSLQTASFECAPVNGHFYLFRETGNTFAISLRSRGIDNGHRDLEQRAPARGAPTWTELVPAVGRPLTVDLDCLHPKEVHVPSEHDPIAFANEGESFFGPVAALDARQTRAGHLVAVTIEVELPLHRPMAFVGVVFRQIQEDVPPRAILARRRCTGMDPQADGCREQRDDTCLCPAGDRSHPQISVSVIRAEKRNRCVPTPLEPSYLRRM